MANLKDLIVNGPARFLGKIYGKISNADLADRATADGSGNVITSTYLNKAINNQLSGALSFSAKNDQIASNAVYYWCDLSHNMFELYCQNIDTKKFTGIILPNPSVGADASAYVGTEITIYYHQAPNAITVFSDANATLPCDVLPPGSGSVKYLFSTDGFWITKNDLNRATFDKEKITKKVGDIRCFSAGMNILDATGAIQYISDNKSYTFYNIINVSDVDKLYFYHTINTNNAPCSLKIAYFTCASHASATQSMTFSKIENRDLTFLPGYEYSCIDVSNYQGVRLCLYFNNETTNISNRFKFDIFMQKKPYFMRSPLMDKSETTMPTIGASSVNPQGLPGSKTNPSTKFYNAYSEGGNYELGYGCFDYLGQQANAVFLKGKGRGLSEITDTTGNYPYAAATFSEGIIEDVTFRVTTVGTQAVYACHIDYNAGLNKTVIYRNCDFISEITANAIGIGLRNGQHIIFENCRFIGSAPAFIHDCPPGNSTYSGNLQYISFINCQFITTTTGYTPINISTVGNNTNKMVMTFINNTFETGQAGNGGLPLLGSRTAEGCLCGSSIYLGDASHGNNYDLLNAY